MGRTASGWRLRRPKGRTVWIVRFTHDGRVIDRSTGKCDPGEAAGEAAKIYADFIQRNPEKHVAKQKGDTPSLEALLAMWIGSDATLDRMSKLTYECYAGHYGKHFGLLLRDVTTATAAGYMSARLRLVLSQTVRQELSVLRSFLKWATLNGHLQRDVVVPSVPQRATGTKALRRTRVAAGELTPDQCRALIALLPETANYQGGPPWHVRARFAFAYETSLRPGCLDELSVPEHWQPGATTLKLTAAIDKVRWGREVPLSAAAIACLELAAPAAGLIFGAHDYRWPLRAAAAAALPPHLAATFNGAHFRSARITHALELGGNLPGVQYLAGHKQASTTSRYARPSMRAALQVLAAASPIASPPADG